MPKVCPYNRLGKIPHATTLIAFFVITFIAATNLLAQSGQKFTGHVADPAGAIVVDATVTITNEGTARTNVQHTSKAGDYSVAYLHPGTYTITVSKDGFQTLAKRHIALSVDQSSNIDFQLAVGAVDQTVTVNANAVQLEVSKADRGEIIDNQRIEQLPVDSNNPLKLFNLTAGTVDRGQAQYPRPFDNVNQNQYANGVNATPQQNLDGATNDNQGNYNGFIPGDDSVQEYKVVTNPYDAQYGRSGGAAIDIELKAGTNKIRGSAYEFLRRRFLDANQWQNSYSGIPRADHHRDQFGFELDGPVVIPKLYSGRDKTFFVIQLEQMWDTVPNSSGAVNSIPPTAWLTGDFSEATYYNTTTKQLMPLTIYDPLSPLQTVVDPVDGLTKRAHLPFPGNIIPKDRLDPVGLNIASFYAPIIPNTTPGAGFAPYQNNYYWLQTEYDNWHSALVKLDHNLTGKDHVTARWAWQQRFAQANQTGIPPSDPASTNTHQAQPKANTAYLDEIHVFNPNTVLDNKFSLMTVVNATYQGETAPGMLSQIGFGNHLVDNVSFPDSFPKITATGFINFGPQSSGAGNVRNSHTLAYQPSLTLVKGKHTIRLGLDARWQQYAQPGTSAGNTFAFTPTWTGEYYNGTTPAGYQTGNSIASMLLGDLSTASVVQAFEPFYSQHYYAPWVQDDFKVTPDLTLNLGLRWDILEARTERHNKLDYIFNPAVLNPVNTQIKTQYPTSNPAYTGGTEFAGVNGNPRGAYKTQYGNIQPRVGAAYRVNNKTSLRGGFGIMYLDNENTDSSTGFSSTTNYNNSLDNGITPYGHLSDPFSSFVPAIGSALGYLTNLGNTFSFTNPNYHLPRLMMYSITVQRLLSSRDSIDVSYSGNRATGLDSSVNINPYSAQVQAPCDVERGGNRQNCDNAALGQVTNPFYQVAAFQGTSYNTNATISKLNLSRPFPAFGDITENSMNILRTWYDSLQVNYGHQFAYDISFHAAYTHSKTMQAGNVIDAVNGILGRNISTSDIPNQLALSGVYTLPVGRGHSLLGNSNRIVDGIVGGWQASEIYVYTQGVPWFPNSTTTQTGGSAPTGNWEISGPITVKNHDLAPGSSALPAKYTRLVGVTPCIGYKNTDTGVVTLAPIAVAENCAAAQMIMAPNGYAVAHNIDYTGVRLPPSHQFDASLSKTFDIYERMKLHVRMDALNVLNHPNWQNSYNSSYNSLDFGSQQKGPQGPSSVSRQIQLSAKVTW